MPNRYSNIDFKRTFESLDEETIKTLTDSWNKQNEQSFKNLCEGLKNNTCYLCGKHIDDCSVPCFHWLLNPKIKKKELRKLFEKPISITKLYTYLTWVANSDTPFININDISADTLPNKMFEATIKYKDFEWSFSLGKTDYNAEHYGKSHYHLQAKKNGFVYIKYNDFHIECTPEDMLMIEMIRQDAVEYDAGFSAGLESLNSGNYPFVLLQNNYMGGTLGTFVLTSTINDAQLQELLEENKSTGLYFADIIDKLNSDKGYNIKYILYFFPNGFVSKEHRT
jgi:hypothetical protein